MKLLHNIKYIFSVFLITASILIGAFGFSFLNGNYNLREDKNTVYASNAIELEGVDFKVEKVARKIKIDDSYNYSMTEPTEYETTLVEEVPLDDVFMYDIPNNSFVMLNNACINSEVYQYEQNIKISITNKLSYDIVLLKVSATLNGEVVGLNKVEKDDNESTTFLQYINVKNLVDKDGNRFYEKNGSQGYFELTFDYMLRTNNNEVIDPVADQIKYGFYILNEQYYINASRENPDYKVNDNYGTKNSTEPKMINKDSIDRKYYVTEENVYSSEKHFYNFSEKELPNIVYDASRFNVDYYYESKGNKIDVKSNFVLDDNKNGILTFNHYLPDVISPIKTETFKIKKQVGVEKNKPVYPFSLEFRNLGNYYIHFNYVVEVNGNFIVCDDEFSKREGVLFADGKTHYINYDRLRDIELYIYGAQPFYNKNGEFAEFKADGYFTDITFNQNLKADNLLDNIVIPNGQIAKTDQPNVKMDLSANLMYSEKKESLSEYYYYPNGKRADGQPSEKIKKVFDNETRFGDNGFYEVVIRYNFFKYQKIDELTDTVVAGNLDEKIQVFAFEIQNTPPTVLAYNDNNQNGIFDEGDKKVEDKGFTNKQLTVEWKTENEDFFVEPLVDVYFKTFEEDKFKFIDASILGEKQMTFNEEGNYMLNVHFGKYTLDSNGRRISSNKPFYFNIDKTGIENVLVQNVYDNNGYVVGNAKTTDLFINSKFILNYNEKLSGAKINVKYSFVPLSSTNIASDFFVNNNENYVKNGYVLKGITNDIPYIKSSTFKSGDKLIGNNAKSVKFESGLYVFYLEDEAGNKAVKTVLLDNSKPLILQKNEVEVNDSPYVIASPFDNIIATDAVIHWGTHKAIKIEAEIKGNEEINKFLFSNYILVPLKNIKIVSNVLADEQGGQTILNSKPAQNNVNFRIMIDENQNDYEKYYFVYLNDISAWLEGKNAFDNSTSTMVEVNLDKSLLLAYMGGDIKYEGDNEDTYKRLYKDRASNRKNLIFTYKNSIGTDYEIESLNYSYHPFSFDKTSSIYPFAENDTLIDLMALSTKYTGSKPEGIKISYDYITYVINSKDDNVYKTKTTLDGLYKVTRTYKGEIDKVRTYTFIVDKNGIIELPSEEFIGEFIATYLGPKVNRKSMANSEFLVKYSNEKKLDFTTNLLPINLFLPYNKYPLIVDGEGETANFDVAKYFSALKLRVRINREYKIINDGSTQIVDEEIYNSVKDESLNANGTYDIPKMFKVGNYTITIEDNSGHIYEGENGSREYNHNANSIQIKFEIKTNTPSGKFYNKEDQELRNVNSYREGDIYFAFDMAKGKYEAKIDKNNLEIYRRVSLPDGNLGNKELVYKIVDGREFINLVGAVAREDKIYLSNKTLEGMYTFNIHYEGNLEDYSYSDSETGESFNNYASSIDFYIDYTAPRFNLNNLLREDKYLSSEEKEFSTFMNRESKINFENYSFAVSSNDMLTYADYNTPKYDTYKVYMRKYDKYRVTDQNNEYNKQSLVRNDVLYNDYDKEPVRLRFENKLKDGQGRFVYSQIQYGKPFNEQEAYGGNGYYEIIEVDEAGNQAIYTLYITDEYGFKITTNQEEEEFIQEDISIQNVGLELKNIEFENLTNNQPMSSDYYYTIKIENLTKDRELILKKSFLQNEKNNEFADLKTIIDKINEFIYVDAEYDETGSKFIISFIPRNVDCKTLKITYNTPGSTLVPKFTDVKNGFYIDLPNNTNTTTIVDFKAYQAVNGDFVNGIRLSNDSDGKIISSINVDMNGNPYKYLFLSTNGDAYRFEFTDNFGRSYFVDKIVGLNDVADVRFYGTTKYKSGKTWTADAVSIYYQSKLNSIKIYRNGEDITNYYMKNPDKEGIVRIDLHSASIVENVEYSYHIEFLNLNGSIKEYDFVYYTKLPEIIFKDKSENIIENLNDTTTSREVLIQYDNENILFPISISGKREYVDAENKVYVQDLGNIKSGDKFVQQGKYTLTVYSELNTIKVIRWNIKKLSKPNYAVLVDAEGQNSTVLEPSDIKFETEGKNIIMGGKLLAEPIDLYFSSKEYVIELNTDKNLTYNYPNCEPVIYKDGGGYPITIYQIRTNSKEPVYCKNIAVATIPSSNNILSAFEYTRMTGDNGGEETFEVVNLLTDNGASKIITDSPIEVSWNNYYLLEPNTIKLTYYFNDKYVDTIGNSIDKNVLKITSPGIYTFVVSDLAGNNHSFGLQKTFTLVVVNEVLFKINNQDPINNSVFNENVTINIEKTSYYQKNNFSVKVKRNGKEYNPIVNGYSYLFTEFGFYEVSFNAVVNEKPISNVFKFSMINKNSSLLSYEYVGASGYEIYKVEKEGIDVTPDLVAGSNSSALTKLELSSEIGGNGRYKVFVRANFEGARPSQEFTFEVWINNEMPYIKSSTPFGETTTKDITLTFNPYLIYRQLGECGIYVNNKLVYSVTKDRHAEHNNASDSVTLSKPGEYIVEVKTLLGNTLYVNKVQIKEPLNAIAVIVIVLSVAVVVTLVVIFFRLKKRMKVK